MSRSARVIVVLALVGTLGQAFSLVSRGRIGNTDFGVFHRTVQLLANGMGGELYPGLDAVTTWPISLSPTGLAIFQPLARLSPVAASSVWALMNLGMLALALVTLRRLLRAGEGAASAELLAWATSMLLVFSWASIQVGQFSVLFVACWILALSALTEKRHVAASLLLAVPASVKLYPVMMLAVPLSLVKTTKEGVRQLLLFAASACAMALLVPMAVYGSRGWALNVSFWQNIILSPSGQVDYMQTVRHANQSLDTLLLRYMSYEPDFHDLFVSVPHLWWAKGDVVAIAHVVRVVLLAVTIGSVLQWRRREPRDLSSRHDLLTMAGLWSSTLYLMLPETKARYAVYTVLGFLPLLQRATDPGARDSRSRAWTEIAVLTVLILVLLPGAVQVWGVGFIGPLLLWLANLRSMRDTSAARMHPLPARLRKRGTA